MIQTFARLPSVTLAVLTALAVAGCDGSKSAPPPPPPAEVGTVIVQPERVSLSTELPGRTSAFRVAEVRPQVSGIVIKRLFREGSDVKAGEQLYQIDPATYQATLNSAKADLAKAEANLKSVKAKASRYAELVTINAISKQEYDDIVASQQQGEAQVASAKAGVDMAKINLDYTKVYAPIGGRIGRSSVTEGALVTANQAAQLASVQQLDPIYVDVTQSSAEVMKLRAAIASGQIRQGNNAAPVSLTVEGGEQAYGQPGELQFSDVTVDQTTGAVTLRAIFPNPNLDLLPGLFVRARISQGVKEQAIAVPQQAVVRTPDGGAMVWVVDTDSKVAPHPVKTGQALGSKWLVTDGLQAGDQIVVEGLQKIRPGAPVKPVPAASTAAAAPDQKAR
ncbi:MAG TPA: efflux RND transporter periplasmic adaptor subunit [Patescibacteria group bacterium]|nr:efflux RND transporter periplasmic adaptor subunit [Patescibacteria group bacterium]